MRLKPAFFLFWIGLLVLPSMPMIIAITVTTTPAIGPAAGLFSSIL
jgi:hypothetical protein